MDAENHVGLGVGNDGVGMGGDVVEKVACALHCVFGGAGLGRCKRGEGDKNCGIDCAAVVKEGANDLLDVLLLILGERSGIVDGLGVLDGCSVGGDSVLMGLVLGFDRRLVSKSQE